ncbi:hypothetical protein BWZ20_06600 [Winogradskyella sp. J14-2]|uniref:hypothetical protein n=1 Tax=Winogradskyella sp. J14-2 TaxID=1936080 RepID=UPI000972A912|nr:hypothetical protein [Winogradskyella sp. J14-2]APY07991.1 hypothetical protein BWZ20_06600 [Winogradskyella sp. J14-2]
MIKRLIVICIAIISSCGFAQQGTASPYSFYGIGSLKFKGTVENRSMGGIGVYLDSIHLNLRNPASYVGKNVDAYPYDGESRPVKFAVAGTSSNVTLKSDSGEAEGNSAIFDYIALSVPIGKFGFGFGLMPYTSVGYKLDDINNNDAIVNRFRGEGGVNRVFAGFGYQISKKLSAGVDINYNFGNVQNSAIEFAYTDDGDLVELQTREDSRSDLSGLNLNFGLAYKTKLSEKLELSATATFAPESKLSSDNTRAISTIDVTATGTETVLNTVDIDLESQNLRNTDLTLPSRWSIGTGLGKPQSWFIGAEYTHQNTSRFSNPFYSNDVSTFENASQVSLGGFYIPDFDAFTGYFKRVVYRAGINFANTGLVVKNESIKEFGISFGLGLPVGQRSRDPFSNLNLGLEIGKRGTTNNNLIQENFINFNVSLSLNSRWFRQKKYN